MQTHSQSSTPSYVYRNGFGMYYFRIAIPRKLRDIVNKYEIRRSLKTTSYAVAVKKARRLYVAAESLFQGDNVNEKELKDFLITGRQIKMTGPVRIGNGILECGGLETDPNQPNEELQILEKLIQLIKTTEISPESGAMQRLIDGLLASNPSPLELVELLGKVLHRAPGTIPERTTLQDTAPPSMMLGDLIEKYSVCQVQEGSWTPKTAAENAAIFDMLRRHFNEIPIKEITHEDADQFRSILLRLPPNMNKNPLYREKSVSVIINMKPATTLSPASVNKYMRRVSAMFSWAEERQHIAKNPFRKKKIREDKRPNERRDMLSGQDLAALFSPDRFYSELDQPHKYFIPLIGLYTGARLNEIARLDGSDIVDVDGINCFRFITSKRKVHTERFVPVHPHLIELGLLKYAQAQPKKLFPELSKRRDGYGHEVSRWYNNYRRKCGLTELRNRDFHSYRHTLATSLRRKGVDSGTISEILGHAHNGPTSSTTEAVYIKPDQLRTLAEAIEKLDFGEPIKSLDPFFILFPTTP